MVYFFQNIISYEECSYLSEKFYIEKNFTESQDFNRRNAYGFRPSSYFDQYLNKFKSTIENIVGNNFRRINPVNTFIREYFNGANLEGHIDRPDINITMSLCLDSSIKMDWPLYVNVNGEVRNCSTRIGDGVVIIDSNKHYHWRDKLVCDESEKVLQFFLHWSYEDEKSKTLI